MKVLIRYCPVWDGYDEAAQDVSDEIKENFDRIDVEILEGDKGEFTVIVGDDPAHLIFDKSNTNRFPNDEEIVNLLRGKNV